MKIRMLVAGAVSLLTMSITTLAMPVHNVPEGLGRADYVGRVDASKEMNLTVFLKMHDQADFDRAVDALYDPASPTFQKWFTDEDFARYAPTPAEIKVVSGELLRQGFTLVAQDPRGFWIRVHGTAATVEKAFQTELHDFSYEGRVFQTHTRDAALAGPANELIETVAGIDRFQVRPMVRQVLNPATGKPIVKVPLKTAYSWTTFLSSFTPAPLSAASGVSLSDQYGQYATYKGYIYGNNGLSGGFTPKQLQAHYGIPFSQTSPAKTYDGTGQTIALVEGYGYPNELADANEAASLFGLPALVSGTTFKEIQPEGPPPNKTAGYLTGWSTEIALDIQSVHSLAPKANILVVDSAGQDDEDQLYSLNWIVCPTTGSTCPAPLATVVSSSWENGEEIISGTLQNQAFNTALKTGAAKGVSFNFSSGDNGDLGVAQPNGAQMLPSDSPYATAVGGTTILNQPGTSPVKYSVLGWGNDQIYLYSGYVVDPPQGQFSGGSGGGQSIIWSKPSWQSALYGSWRKTPDVSALADPYTGFAIVVSDSSGNQSGEVIGGTSLACPLFSAMWAVANQFKGASLGLAAPYMYAHGTYTAPPMTDAIPPTTAQMASDVYGSATDYNGITTNFTSTTLFTDSQDLVNGGNLSLFGQARFLSAMWEVQAQSGEELLVVSFGTDTSLLDATGWDYSTGNGEPNGMAFVQHVTGLTVGH